MSCSLTGGLYVSYFIQTLQRGVMVCECRYLKLEAGLLMTECTRLHPCRHA